MIGALFGIIRKGRRLDHHAVSFEGIKYYSPQVHAERHVLGSVAYVDLKVNPLDLRKAYIRASDGSWLPAWADQYAHVENLDLHLLRLLGKQSRMLFGSDTLESRIRAIPRLEDVVGSAYDDGISAANAQRAARAMGLGTHKIFAQIGHSGDIDRAAPALVAPGVPAVATATEPTSSSASPTKPAKPIIPSFTVDHSLGTKR